MNRLFAPADEMSSDAFPPRFDEAMEQIQKMNKLWEQAQIPEQTQIAAQMVELMPRLVHAYGPDGVIAMFSQLINEIAGTPSSSDTKNGGAMPCPNNGLPN
ncbi:MAG: hypothetical protein WD005_04995 [Haliea sp.]